jgi:hypothetical protein
MTYVKARKSGLGFASLLLAIVVTAGTGADGATGHRSHAARAHGSNTQGQNVQSASIRESARPLGMRYYGGPKSPMWSGQ